MGKDYEQPYHKNKNKMIYKHKNKVNHITSQELKINTKQYHSSYLKIWQEFYSDTKICLRMWSRKNCHRLLEKKGGYKFVQLLQRKI